MLAQKKKRKMPLLIVRSYCICVHVEHKFEMFKIKKFNEKWKLNKIAGV